MSLKFTKSGKPFLSLCQPCSQLGGRNKTDGRPRPQGRDSMEGDLYFQLMACLTIGQGQYYLCGITELFFWFFDILSSLFL